MGGSLPNGLYACSQTQLASITGQTKGKLNMVLERVKTEKDMHSITGEFSGSIIDHAGGAGQLECVLEGKIQKNSIQISFSGEADVVTKVSVDGTMKGTISDSHGFGTWSIVHSEGSSVGEWAMKKIKP